MLQRRRGNRREGLARGVGTPQPEASGGSDSARRVAAAADAAAASGGPTIVDINSGFVMAPGARLVNLYRSKRKPFGGEDYELYLSLIHI